MDPGSELTEFHRFLGEKLSHGDTVISPEEALDEWRLQNGNGAEAEDDDFEAIQEAAALYKAGDRGVTYEEFDREFRKRHGLPPPQ
ncbi:MAG: hypothetical protein IAF94_07775 [Pirellulaceae bacterium]|nr:hypothetical protein [Pirellulaceae bacterium]